MCTQCDYNKLMSECGLKPSPRRVLLMSVIGSSGRPLTAAEIHSIVLETESMDRVTVYRILDTLVKYGLAEKIGSPDARSFFYGLSPSSLHPAHPHFFCRMCGKAKCLSPSIVPDVSRNEIKSMIPGITETVQINIAGVCSECLTDENSL